MLNPSILLVEMHHGKIVDVVQEEKSISGTVYPHTVPLTGGCSSVHRSLLYPSRGGNRRIVSFAPVGRILPGVADSATAIWEIFLKIVFI